MKLSRNHMCALCELQILYYIYNLVEYIIVIVIYIQMFTKYYIYIYMCMLYLHVFSK